MRRSPFHPDDVHAATQFTQMMNDCLALDKPHLTIAQLARQLRVSTDRLHRWLDPISPTYNLPYYLATRWDQVVGSRLLWQVNYATGYRPPDRLEPPATKGHVLALVTTALGQLTTMLDAITPCLDSTCAHAVQGRVQDATLHIIQAVNGINHWAHNDRPLAA